MIVQKPFSLSVLDKSKEGLFVNFAEFSGIAEDGFYNLSIDDWISWVLNDIECKIQIQRIYHRWIAKDSFDPINKVIVLISASQWFIDEIIIQISYNASNI